MRLQTLWHVQSEDLARAARSSFRVGRIQLRLLSLPSFHGDVHVGSPSFHVAHRFLRRSCLLAGSRARSWAAHVHRLGTLLSQHLRVLILIAPMITKVVRFFIYCGKVASNSVVCGLIDTLCAALRLHLHVWLSPTKHCLVTA